ncbi:hypothetical protein Kfla_5102 [Kribbella flavida DSM 17836]|uniref:Uncharacterized protein n=1 Tax=Kribbella flavida (strain DSM 17836 / JCM 10339 / NBRC 14399) TaxID=479435 RepID=D2Q3J5_KRIFD|nr:hypothetical protein [Kribbella flavida]ADB34118.1 hypothetical protein Kfla_5102 [Kribbella flavida DSM 17836]
MTTTDIRRPRPVVRTAPLTARTATSAWFLAVGAGVAESVLGLVGAIGDGTPVVGLVAQVALRTIVYGGLFVTIDRYFRHGVPWSRWLLTVLLGTVGLATLLISPISWLADGADVASVDVTAGFVVFAVLRTVHVLAVITACVLTFHPDTTAWFRRARS